ncbi:hypothetical protein ACFWBG_11285 [Nocardia salmonicida]|uniref:hypothetical protein n=1 Tax=Nocardia salmonicida TaxID=53431 RepID=UPI00366AA63B
MPDLGLLDPCGICRSREPDIHVDVDGGLICQRCALTCAQCHRCGTRSITLTDTTAAGQLCSTCVSRLHPCASCSEATFTRLPVDTGGFVCGICAHQLYDQCFQCERYTLHSRYVVGNQRACPECAQLQRSCRDCGTLISGRRGCDRCADPHALWNYSYRPDPIFHGTGPLFLGLELEVIVPDDRFDDAIATATDSLGSLGYLKRDSSIRPSGFEIVCHPMSNVLSRNDLFAHALTGIDDIGSIPAWMFSEHSKTILVDPDSERSWTVAMLKAALGKHRTSVQAKELVAALAPNREAQRLWAASVNVSRGRDSRCLLHAHGTNPHGVSYQLSLTDSIASKHIQLVTATPESYSGPEID